MAILRAYDTPILAINFCGEQMRPNTTRHFQRQWRHQRGSVSSPGLPDARYTFEQVSKVNNFFFLYYYCNHGVKGII